MALAQSGPVSQSPATIRVQGESTISVTPDIAEMDVGVLTQAASAQAAADQNGRESAQVVSQLRQALPGVEIKTIDFSVNPNYQYPKEGGQPTIQGYTASNTVRLELTDLTRIQQAVEAATRAGAKNINRLQFALRDEKKARAEALGEAARRAKVGAEALSTALQLKLGRIFRVEETQPVILSPARDIEPAALAASDSGPRVPTTPGRIQVHASVQLTYEVEQR